jgi:hypothetical protein
VNVYDKRVKKEFRPKRILKRGETL